VVTTVDLHWHQLRILNNGVNWDEAGVAGRFLRARQTNQGQGHRLPDCRLITPAAYLWLSSNADLEYGRRRTYG